MRRSSEMRVESNGTNAATVVRTNLITAASDAGVNEGGVGRGSLLGD